MRTLLVCLAVTVLVALTAGVALANTIAVTVGRDDLDGTTGNDLSPGKDGVLGDRPGKDRLVAGPGAGHAYYREGDDQEIRGGGDGNTPTGYPDGSRDEVYSGEGTVHASPDDPVADDCEDVWI